MAPAARLIFGRAAVATRCFGLADFDDFADLRGVRFIAVSFAPLPRVATNSGCDGGASRAETLTYRVVSQGAPRLGAALENAHRADFVNDFEKRGLRAKKKARKRAD
ncbi:MAG TPA: hypothetical protein VNF27_14745 [Candidatus Binataceae bacterium]|nr:hypothetical protein [Candidatus Binataceae bacterium]